LQLRRLPCFRHTRRAFTHDPDLDSNRAPPRRAVVLDLRRVQCDPLHYRDRFKSRRLDSHQHHPPFLISTGQDRRLSQSSHVGKSTGARSRTLSGGFGGRLLSREHTGMRPACRAGS
jgi:hypothetical protein